jgi:hypothetical protein
LDDFDGKPVRLVTIHHVYLTNFGYTDMRTRQRLFQLSLSLILVSGYGCNNVIDCLDNDGPEFITNSIANPVVNQEYNQTITVAINNEPRDDSFIYDFSVSGSLPAGITGVANGRNYILSGTPTTAGTSSFSLFVMVDEPPESGLCFYNASRTFEVTVQP